MNQHSASIRVSAVVYELVRRRVAELRAAGQPVTMRSVFTEALTHATPANPRSM